MPYAFVVCTGPCYPLPYGLVPVLQYSSTGNVLNICNIENSMVVPCTGGAMHWWCQVALVVPYTGGGTGGATPWHCESGDVVMTCHTGM